MRSRFVGYEVESHLHFILNCQRAQHGGEGRQAQIGLFEWQLAGGCQLPVRQGVSYGHGDDVRLAADGDLDVGSHLRAGRWGVDVLDGQ